MVELLPCATTCDSTSALRESFGRNVRRDLDSVPTQLLAPPYFLMKVQRLWSCLPAGASPALRDPQKFFVVAIAAIAVVIFVELFAVVVDFSAIDCAVAFDLVVDDLVAVDLVLFVVDIVVDLAVVELVFLVAVVV